MFSRKMIMCFSRPFKENGYGSFSLVLSRKMVMGLFRPGSRTIVTRVAITDKCCMYSNVGLSSSMISSLPGGIHRPQMEINTPKTACGGVIIQFHRERGGGDIYVYKGYTRNPITLWNAISYTWWPLSIQLGNGASPTIVTCKKKVSVFSLRTRVSKLDQIT